MGSTHTLWGHDHGTVTIGVLFAIKGCSFNRFYQWLKANLEQGFPSLPERTRLLRRLIAYRGIIDEFFAKPSVICIADSYGIELRHPIREFDEPKTERIGEKGKSNGRWIHGMKLMLMINNEEKIVNFAIETANRHDQCFNKKLSEYEDEAIILVDMGFRDKNGVPSCLEICEKGIWNDRMCIERLFSKITTPW